MTHELEINGKQYLLVGVPKDGYHYEVFNALTTDVNLIYSTPVNEQGKDMPPNVVWLEEYAPFKEYRIIATISNLTEEECEPLVESRIYERSGRKGEDVKMFRDYDYPHGFLTDLDTAKASFISLLKSEGILAKSFVEAPAYFVTPNSHTHVTGWEDLMAEYNALQEELILIEKK
jgi:hypothetical protein